MDSQLAKAAEKIGVHSFNRSLFREWSGNAAQYIEYASGHLLKEMPTAVRQSARVLSDKCPNTDPFFVDGNVDLPGIVSAFPGDLKAGLPRALSACFSFAQHINSVGAKLLEGTDRTFQTHPVSKQAADAVTASIQSATKVIGIESCANALHTCHGEQKLCAGVLNNLVTMKACVPQPLLKLLEARAGSTWDEVESKQPLRKKAKAEAQ